ncbi:MAG: hypothetical protein IT266_04510 [Saprospiraceae bacterium]|nr:hypothetical protein [Saprospiraceae bacterium]
MAFKKFLVAIVSLNLLVSQFGVNVFALYCCCSRDIAYSLLPQEDACVRHTTEKKCSANGKCCTAHPQPSGPCKNRVVDYLFLDYDAQKPDQDQLPSIDWAELSPDPFFHFFLDTPTRLLHTKDSHFNIPSGTNRLLMHCIRRC